MSDLTLRLSRISDSKVLRTSRAVSWLNKNGNKIKNRQTNNCRDLTSYKSKYQLIPCFIRRISTSLSADRETLAQNCRLRSPCCHGGWAQLPTGRGWFSHEMVGGIDGPGFWGDPSVRNLLCDFGVFLFFSSDFGGF